jgi:hypothetical protein
VTDRGDGSGEQEAAQARSFRVEAAARYQKKGGFEGTGSVAELWPGALRIERATLRVPVGERIRVSFSLMRGSEPIMLSCIVSAECAGGFVADFAEIEARHRNALRLAIAQLARRKLSEDETGLTILRSSAPVRRRGSD